ncbi:DUF559 domain-containing protein [Aeromicrobium duanguangcaii]|uniref:DUF559 domain-containing protein n=1 Tax=Aeromicrobium duanguangcaii TaxID=2968086 RepID=A0ABY5KBT8_9ACTN|nr:DUF559 domain-containing protein [Aeromicrobium duanguangcaii]MCD9154669.1 DUF559 domain-containing protein [Aeromicrobium duanguangcaii]UUI67917.1 DUF559 domain-containing protein [Aeromicrobium duanguangcaii]
MADIPSSLQGRPFTVAEARAAGLTDRQLGHSRFRRLFRGVYVVSDGEVDRGQWLAAALLAGPQDAAISHRSAQAVYGPELSGDDEQIHLSTRRNAVTRDRRIRVHRRKHAIGAREVDGLRVTSPPRTFVDCALALTFVQLVVFGDWLIQRKLATFDELLAYCHDRHLDGVVKAREAMRFLVADARSPMETVVRLMLVRAGLPHPAVNSVIRDAAGGRVACVDLAFWRYRVVVEYDGRWHERVADQRRWDRDRREHLERLGWRVIVLHDTDLARPALIVHRVHDALVRGGLQGRRPWLSPAWHAEFAARI